MLNTRRAALFAAVFSVGLLAAAGARGETLADAIALAYQNNPTLQAQRATQRALDESYVQARTGWRPTLTLSASASWSESQTPLLGRGTDFDGDGRPDTPGSEIGGATRNNQGTAALTFNQPLWTGGRVAAAVNAANADVRGRYLSLQLVRSW